MNERDEWISQRAYALWEMAGRPHGQDHEHWSQATLEWETLAARNRPASGAGARLINDYPETSRGEAARQ